MMVKQDVSCRIAAKNKNEQINTDKITSIKVSSVKYITIPDITAAMEPIMSEIKCSFADLDAKLSSSPSIFKTMRLIAKPVSAIAIIPGANIS